MVESLCDLFIQKCNFFVQSVATLSCYCNLICYIVKGRENSFSLSPPPPPPPPPHPPRFTEVKMWKNVLSSGGKQSTGFSDSEERILFCLVFLVCCSCCLVAFCRYRKQSKTEKETKCGPIFTPPATQVYFATLSC